MHIYERSLAIAWALISLVSLISAIIILLILPLPCLFWMGENTLVTIDIAKLNQVQAYNENDPNFKWLHSLTSLKKQWV